MINKLFIFICFSSVVPILYLLLKNNAEFKKNIVLSVTLPHNAREDDFVIKQRVLFKKWLGRISLLLIITYALYTFFLAKSTGYFMFFSLVWFVLAILLLYIVFIYFNNRLQKYKISKGWIKCQEFKGGDNFIQHSINHKKLSLFHFMPPIILSLLPLCFKLFLGYTTDREVIDIGLEFIILNVIMVVITLSFYFLYKLINTQRVDKVENNTPLNNELTRIRVHYWNKMFLILAYSTSILNIFLWFDYNNANFVMLPIIVYTIFVVYISIHIEFKVRKLQGQLTTDTGKGEYIDEDKYWIGGVLYFNPEDKNLFANDRVGIGMSMNMAKPMGKIVYFLTTLILLLMPLIGVQMIIEEKSSIDINLDDDGITYSHTGDYEIKYDDITDTELLMELPKTKKIFGTGLDNLKKGTFRVGNNIGKATLNLNPKVSPYILIETDNEKYILGSESMDETIDCYRNIIEKLE